jgi:hypothetical protein
VATRRLTGLEEDMRERRRQEGAFYTWVVVEHVGPCRAVQDELMGCCEQASSPAPPGT